MHGLRAILGPGSKLWYELRSAFLPLLVFSSAVFIVVYCWRDLVTIVKVPTAAREPQKISCHATNPALLSVNHSCQPTNAQELPSSDTKATATH